MHRAKKQIGSLQWIPSGSQRGSADIHAVVNGRAIKIEAKAGRDVQSAAQKEYQKAVEDAGGIYYIAHSFSGFLEFYDNLIEDVRHGS